MHNELCYNNVGDKEDCDLCTVIEYVLTCITPECTCGSQGMWRSHHISCKWASFMNSQFLGGIQS